MNDPYKLALAVARFLGAVNLVAGIAAMFAAATILLIGAIAVVLPSSGGAPNPTARDALNGVMATLLIYGTLYLVVGAGILLCSRWIARTAAKVFVVK